MQYANWSELIERMTAVKAELVRADRGKIYPPNIPFEAATEEQLVAAERVLGERLAEPYREFLGLIGGWSGFLQANHLFGPSDFMGSRPFVDANQRLGWLSEEGVLQELGFRTDDLLPIAMSINDRDLFVMTRQSTAIPGTVIWFSGYEIERYADFAAYFEAMISYNQVTLDTELAKARQE
jgi:hypothetical protein